MKMRADEKLRILDQIYGIYDDFAGSLDIACKKYCSHCCTRKVTITTLEGYNISEHLISNNKTDLFNNLIRNLQAERFVPLITTNRLADLCIQGKEIPDEQTDTGWESCPLLASNLCPIYAVRPFGCRCMVSKISCGDKGYAEQDPFVFTVNNVFLQYIEHIDSLGYFGNLMDVLLFLSSERNLRMYTNNSLDCLPSNLIQNQPVKALMIPPEQRRKIDPILKALQGIKVPVIV